MDIEIIKPIVDLRPGRTKLLRKGLILTVTKELGEKYLKKKAAKIVVPEVQTFFTIKDRRELEKWEEENSKN